MKKIRTTIRAKGQITIPAEVREAARLAEGDSIEVTMTADGILLKPHKLIDSTQAWFWEPAWQAREREADADLTAGRTTRQESSDEFLAALDERMKPLDADT
jgi:antitoxin PrlF